MDRTMTRRERREQMRQQRPSRGGPAPRRGGIGGAWIGLGVIAVAAAVVAILYFSGAFATGAPPVNINDRKYEVANEVIGEQTGNEGNAHVPAGQKVEYAVHPPTGGSHWAQPAGPTSWGIKDTQFPDEAVVHNLEHGGILIGYKGLSDADVEKLRDIVRVLMNSGYPKIVLEPYAQMSDARIGLSAWRWSLKLANFDDVQIVKFVKAHYDGPDAPERGVR